MSVCTAVGADCNHLGAPHCSEHWRLLACLALWRCVATPAAWSKVQRVANMASSPLHIPSRACSLPQERRPAGCDWRSAAMAAAALTSLDLSPAFAWRVVQEPAKLPARLVAATQLLRQLPLENVPGLDPALHTILSYKLLAYTAQLAVLCGNTGTAVQQPVQQQEQLAAHLLQCLASLPGLLRFVAGPQLTDSLTAVAGACQSVLPLADLLLKLSDSISDSPDMPPASQRPRSEQPEAAWCTCTAAALAAVPLLVQAERELRQRGAEEWECIAALLNCLLNLQHAAADAAFQTTGYTQGSPALQQALFRLHTTNCRLVAWCAANRVGGDMPLCAADLRQLLYGLVLALLALVEQPAVEEGASGIPAPPTPERFVSRFACLAIGA